jgi:hypothetical protein
MPDPDGGMMCLYDCTKIGGGMVAWKVDGLMCKPIMPASTFGY